MSFRAVDRSSLRPSRPSSRRRCGVMSVLAVLSLLVVKDIPLAAEADATADATAFSDDDRAYWALQGVERPAMPDVRDGGWARNAVDRFVLAKLEALSLAPSVEADRATLLRRLSFDVIGLPPEPDAVAVFEADESPDAYERQVDRLLASPRLGERWARHWLDLARYAETDGFKADVTRPNAWRYRDYVIAAMNEDKPYDRFLMEQLAGDEIAPRDSSALIATGFLRHWPYEDNGRDVFGQRQNILDDVTDVTAQVCLGLTFKCARCHDHKYDPILRKDYYRLQAFFVAMVPRDDLPVGPAGVLESAEQQLTAWEEATAAVRERLDEIEAPIRTTMRREQMAVFPKDVQAILDKSAGDRTPQEQIIADLASKQIKYEAKDLSGRMAKDLRERWTALRAEMESVDVEPPPELPSAMGVHDLDHGAPDVVMPGDKRREPIAAGFLSILDPGPAELTSVAAEGESVVGRRTVLARWIASRENPLTARVAVNRLWQHHFGVGIVASSGDFGRQGDRPTHGELLDWLADEFAGSAAWRSKPLHRLMVTSAAYRQSSSIGAVSDRAVEVDPNNRLLWRMNLRRVEAEIVRDSVLAASGELNLAMGGPSGLPELPKELSERYGWKPSKNIADRNRRAIYLFAKRNMRLPLLDAFDAPDTHEACCRREQTTTAPQALALLNDEWMLARAAAMADRVRNIAGDEPSAQIETAWRLAFGRGPSEESRRTATAFLTRSPTDAMALRDYCHVLLNANAFVYVD
ncbi:MAG: DUF1549 and DUF1553 domain-containing protein [Pirellulales bacterium]